MVTAYFPSIPIESDGTNYIGQAIISTHILSWSEGAQLKKTSLKQFLKIYFTVLSPSWI